MKRITTEFFFEKGRNSKNVRKDVPKNPSKVLKRFSTKAKTVLFILFWVFLTVRFIAYLFLKHDMYLYIGHYVYNYFWPKIKLFEKKTYY